MAGDIELRAHAWLEGFGAADLPAAKLIVSGIIARSRLGVFGTEEMMIAILGEVVARVVVLELDNSRAAKAQGG